MSVRFPTLSSYADESLRPPPESADAEEDERVSWDWGEALIDCAAYMIDESNHTSAFCPFTTIEGNKEQLQVTFCLNPPPHISYFCIAYTSGENTRFISEPLILATEGNLALISVKHGTNWLAKSTDYNFFVYNAPIHSHELPRLDRLSHPDPGLFPWNKYCYFTQGEVGILRYRASSGNKQQTPFTPPTPTLALTHDLGRRHKPPFIPNTNKDDCDGYKIATLYTRIEESGITHYDLFIYDSKTRAWICEPTVFQQEPPQDFQSDRVITIAGTMVWVDLSQGMILCDLLPEQESTGGGPRQLRYIQLPKPLQPHNFPICVGNSSFSRDITVVDDRIKFVDLEIHDSSPGLNCWTAVTWSMSVSEPEFQKDGEVKSADIIASGAALDLRSLFVAHPTLSFHHGDTLYLMAKARLALHQREAIVIAVDMKNKKMERVAKYTTQRGGGMDFAYRLTTISKYLAPPGDSKANFRKRGLASLGGSSPRKAPAFTLKSGLVQMEEEGHSKKPPSTDDQ
uniref:Uncharacterized protein n=1 Tax=Avena sativa TaxID=4498 RepID=A0ACD5ZL05_AVESA